ncbi:ABC transporter permease [Paludisphaera sp.]|uniref:ABC transporter permease n=1 Tax=Paludisphaera sp. TaxID=2017432 RepID=UPI00301E2685
MIRLLLADVRHRPARAALTSLAVVLSSCVVVWVVSGYDALLGQSIDENAAKALGRFDVVVAAGGGPGGPATKGGGGPATKGPRPGGPATKGARPDIPGGRGGPGAGALPPPLIASLREDAKVAEANVTSQSRVSVGLAEPDPERDVLRHDRPPVLGMPPLDPPLIGTDAHEPPYEMEDGRWIDPALPADAPGEAVLSAGYVGRLKAEVGDDLQVNSEVGRFVVRLVGIVEQPGGGGNGRGGGPGQAGLFVPPALAESINGYPTRVGRVNVALKDGEDVGAFAEELRERLRSSGSSATVTDLRAMKEGMAQGLSRQGTSTLAYSATGVALLAALFIIFTALSMGVSERGRELAVLRAVGLTRGQVAGMVFLEGLFLAMLGWLGGLAAGWGLLRIVASAKPELFPDGAALGAWCVALTGVAAVGGALAASIQPAWRATRVAPLDAMAPTPTAPPTRWIVPAAVVGLALIAINPLIVHVVPMGPTARAWAYAAVGCPAMAIGFLLLAPLVVRVVERIAGPAVAALLGLSPRMLESILTANLWRTLGATVALTIGLGLYISTQTWGYSMLAPFTPGDWAPDMLVGFEPSGLPDDRLAEVAAVPGVIPGRVLAMAVEQPRVAGAAAGTGGGAGGTIGTLDTIVVAGVDIDLAFGGEDPMIPLTYAYGDRDSALARLKEGRGLIVPDHVLESSGLELGDSLELIPPDGPPGRTVAYPIVGAVSLPGWHWMTKMTGLRRRAVRTGGLAFAPAADVRRDFGVERTNFVWLDAEPGASPAAVEEGMQAIAEAHGEATFRAPGVGEVVSKRPYARLTATETIRTGITWRADAVIWGMSQIPLVTLLITSLAVADAVASSVRGRRWELGVLRAVGVTRLGLVRLIVAEAILIAAVVLALGFGFGVTAGWCGAGMSRYLSPFGGMPTPLIIPWARLWIGVGAALALCLLAAVQPAVAAGRAEPLSLLMAGRASA